MTTTNELHREVHDFECAECGSLTYVDDHASGDRICDVSQLGLWVLLGCEQKGLLALALVVRAILCHAWLSRGKKAVLARCPELDRPCRAAAWLQRLMPSMNTPNGERSMTR